MDFPTPPQIEAAQRQFQAMLDRVEGRSVDLLSTPWPELEKGVIKLLGGAFQIELPEHQAIALGLAGVFAARLAKDTSAFWFPNRESAEGAGLGFPDALVVLSPFGAVVDSLRAASLPRLEEISKEIRQALAQAKFSLASQGQQKLNPLDYQRLFDPAFIHFISVDAKKTEELFKSTPDKLARELRDGLSRTTSKLPEEARKQLESQLIGSLGRLEPQKPLAEQVERAPRLVELMVHLFGTVASTGAALEELWQDVAFPLLHIGAPDTFPPLDDEELAAVKKGIDPLFVFLDVVPYKLSAPEEGLMGAFGVDELQLPHASFEHSAGLRLIKLKADRIQGLIANFDPAKSRDAFGRFVSEVQKRAGQPVASSQEGKELFDSALTLLTELKAVIGAKGELHLRRVTEGEAASEGAAKILREAMQGPRLILV